MDEEMSKYVDLSYNRTQEDEEELEGEELENAVMNDSNVLIHFF